MKKIKITISPEQIISADFEIKPEPKQNKVKVYKFARLTPEQLNKRDFATSSDIEIPLTPLVNKQVNWQGHIFGYKLVYNQKYSEYRVIQFLDNRENSEAYSGVNINIAISYLNVALDRGCTGVNIRFK